MTIAPITAAGGLSSLEALGSSLSPSAHAAANPGAGALGAGEVPSLGLGEGATAPGSGEGATALGSGEGALLGRSEGAALGGGEGLAPAGSEGLGASSGSGAGEALPGGGASSFGNVLTEAISSLASTQQNASNAAQALATGTVKDPQAAVMTVEDAQLAMDLASQIRSKATEAAQTIFQTQV